MLSIFGSQSEMEGLEERLEEAKASGDSEKERYLEERITRVQNTIDNKKFYDSYYKGKSK